MGCPGTPGSFKKHWKSGKLILSKRANDNSRKCKIDVLSQVNSEKQEQEKKLMKAKNVKRTGGYSADLANQIVDETKAIQVLSTELEPQFKFEEGKRTEEVQAYKIWVSQEGLPPFEVKFTEQVVLPKYLSVVKFDNLQACEVAYNYYFKADGLKEMK